MSRLKFIASVLLTGLITLGAVCAYADDVVQIVTPVPAPKEVVVIPQGYTTCFNVPSAWVNGVWYPEHRVCQYGPTRTSVVQGDAYVEAHWACTKQSAVADHRGECVNWAWQKGHWIKTFSAY